MKCWSACTNEDAVDVVHQNDAGRNEWPPSSERKRSTPATHTRFSSRGSTAIALEYHPMLVSVAPKPLQLAIASVIGFVSSSVESGSLLVLRSCACHVWPPSSER